MKTTEKINISDSILFLGCARIALSEIALASSIKDKDSVSDFILNEASDFQVMGLLIEGENPGKYDPFKEIALFEDLKDQVLDNYFFTNEMIGEDVTNNIIHEIGAITPKGYSSAGNSIGKVSIISETKFWENVEINLSEAPTKVIDIEKGISAVKKAMSKVKDQIKDHISKGETREANFAKAKLQALQKKQDSLTYHLKQVYKLGKEKSSELAGAAVVKGKAAGVVGATKGAAALKGLPGAAAIGSKLGISSTLAGGGIALAGAVAAALLIYGSVKTYD